MQAVIGQLCWLFQRYFSNYWLCDYKESKRIMIQGEGKYDLSINQL